jgi:acyl-CoA thioester hydrolase
MKKSASSSKDEAPLVTGTHSIRVRYGETDAMGWVYYGTYLSYFEVGRTELIRNIWTSYRALEESGHRLPVVEVACKYQRGALYDDLLTITTGLLLPSPARLRFQYRIVREADAALIATGQTDHCFVNQSGKPIPIPAALAARLEK